MRRVAYFALTVIGCASPPANRNEARVPLAVLATEGRATTSCPPAHQLKRVDRGHSLRLSVEYLTDGGAGAPALRISLRNDDGDSLWVNIRMHIDGLSWPDKEVWLERVDMPGFLENHCMMKRSGLWAGDYMNLGPHAEVSIVRSLDCFLPADAKPETVVVHYKDSSVCPIISGGDWFVGELISTPLVIGPRP